MGPGLEQGTDGVGQLLAGGVVDIGLEHGHRLTGIGLGVTAAPPVDQ